MTKPGIKCVVAISCLNSNDERLYDGGDDMYLQVPPWSKGDKQMTAIHLEANARQQCVVLIRRLMSEDSNCLGERFKEAFAKNDWDVKVRVMPYPEEQ